MLSIEEALKIVIEKTGEVPSELVALPDSTGRLLRSRIFSDLDLPPFDRARMDGYAFVALSTAGAASDSPVRLREVGEVAAGGSFDGLIQPGEAIRIMTGAPVPAGADAVERIEVIEVPGDGSIILRNSVPAGRNITPRGLEVQSGSLVCDSGERITPAVAAALATFGYASVVVSCRPQVALISTGNELVEVAAIPGPGQIRDSNTSSLAGYVVESNGEVVSTSVVGDDFDATVKSIGVALDIADIVILSGGVSMGDYDLVKPALRQLGAEIHFERVAMHPGKPTVFATINGKLIFGLPGNPVSVAVAFHLFTRPALQKLQSAVAIELPRISAFATRDVKGAPPRRSHQPARLLISNGRAEVEPLKWSGSGDLVGFMRANALLVIPENRASIAAGELVETILLPGQEYGR